MRIALVAHNLRAGGGISVGQNLIAAFGRTAPENQYFASIPADLGYEAICAKIPSCVTSAFRHSGYLSRWFFDSQFLPAQLNEFGPDIVLGMGNATVNDISATQAMLCQDSHLWYPRKHFAEHGPSLLAKLLLRRVKRIYFQQSLDRCKLVFCQTQTAAERLLSYYRYAGPVMLCPNAVSQFALDDSGQISVPSALVPYKNHTKLFCLARYYPQKNLEQLVKLFARYRQQLQDHVVFITVSSEHGAQAQRLLADIRRLGLERHIINLGPINQSDLAAYYKNCEALIMPTLLESFSATYIEAMYFGCPILTSDLDFAHEICGDAAIYFDPWDTESIMNAIRLLPLRSDLPGRGCQRIKQLFRSWDQIAADALVALEQLASE